MPSQRTHERIVLAHHIVMTLYGHWPPNDLRGSGSLDFYDEKFAALGPIHRGRKPPALQPTRSEVREFHHQIEPLLNFPIFWIDDAKRQAIAGALASVVPGNRYTVYRCAICSNHMHLIVRRHRDSWQTMWDNLVAAIASALHRFEDIGENHPVISQRPYAVYLFTPDEISGRVDYVGSNPAKEGLPEQHFDFEVEYDGWPFKKKRSL